MNYTDGRLKITIVISNVLWFFSLLSLFILFFIGGPSYYSSPVFKEFWNIGHILFFALTTYKLIQLINYKSTLAIILFSFLYCFTLGVTIELLQSKVGRSVDVHDLYRDALGTLLTLSVYVYKNKKNIKIKYATHTLLLISVLLIIIDQSKLYQAIKVDIEARYNFPYLADFENSNELMQWTGSNLSLSSRHVLSGLYSMKAVLSANTKYSGITLKHMPNNWQGYDYLIINIYSPNEGKLTIQTKITDYEHDMNAQYYSNRFNSNYILLGRQWNTIKIKLEDIENSPKSRKLDLTKISQLGLFTSGLKENKIIYLDAITLI